MFENLEIRLDKQEKEVLQNVLADFSGEVFLIGSRTDLKRRGGDIDIIIIPADEVLDSIELVQQIRTKFEEIYDEKLDVIFLPRNMDKQQKAFFQFVDKVKLQ